MRKITLFVSLLIAVCYSRGANAQAQIDLPVTFDVINVDHTMTDFGGNSTVIGLDPLNPTDSVAITTKSNTAALWAGTTIGTNLGFANAIPFTSNNRSMTIRVYSPDANIPVRLKVEVHGQPSQSVETEALTTVANAWETLTFNFNNQATGTAAFNSSYAYDMASVFFNFGTDGATAGTKTYYFDDVQMATPSGPVQIDLPVTFDVANTDYTMTDFGGNSTVLGADPVNAANTVAITTKGNTAQLWAGTTIGTNLGFANPIPFVSGNHSMTVKVYSPDAGIPVRLKVEVHGQPTLTCETEALTTLVNTWETLTFNFNNQVTGTPAFNASNPYDMASIFFNFGTDGATAGTKTYYFDDVEMAVQTGPAQIDLPVTFDVANTDYTMTDFGGNSTVLGADPVNAANTVAITTKGNTAQLWAGTTIGTSIGFANPIPFTPTNRSMTVKVYSPDAGIPVRLKVEVHGQPTQTCETEATTTTSNAWETLTFNFNNQVTGTAAFNGAYAYDLASIFFNFGTDGATAGTKTYYFDDVEMAVQTGPAQINLPVTFDVANTDYTMTDFGGNATVLGADPVNASNTVAITTKGNTAQLWAGTTIGTNLGFASAIAFTPTNHRMTVRVYSPDANIPVRLKIEVHGQSTLTCETEAQTTVANAWETLTFNFDNQVTGTPVFDAGVAYDMASIFFNFGTDGATAGTKTYYFDDVKLFEPSQIDMPVTFESTTVNYTMTDFGGNYSVLGADPVNSANTVSITTKGNTAQLWAGTTIGTNLGFANPIAFTSNNHKVTVRVYSPDANIPVRLKAEVHGQPTQTVETEALTTLANTWETLVFDFDNQASGTAAFNSGYAYDMLSIFFNFGTDGATAGTKVYYFDDVMMYVPVGLGESTSTGLNVYPNPAQRIMHVQLPASLSGKQVDYRIFDVCGQVVMSGTLNNESIQVDQLANGFYAIELNSDTQQIKKSFIKQ